MTTTFKHINVALVGEDGNAFSIMGRVQKAMRRGDCTQEEMDGVMEQMKSGNYSNLLCTVMDTFSTDGENEEDAEFCEMHYEWLEDCNCTEEYS